MKSFLRQALPAYRNFQVAFTILTLNFAIPCVAYIFAPEHVHHEFQKLNVLLGGGIYAVPEFESHFWRYLGAANVATLAFMCFLLQLNLQRYFAVLAPLCFMKTLAATLWLSGYIAHPEWPVFLAASALDFVTTAAFLLFALRAHRELQMHPEAVLVPALRFNP